jgi:hypothetical protein
MGLEQLTESRRSREPDGIKPNLARANANAYSARTLCHTVLVPLAAELGFNIGVTGREPLDNQPYLRMTRLGEWRGLEEPKRPPHQSGILLTCSTGFQEVQNVQQSVQHSVQHKFGRSAKCMRFHKDINSREHLTRSVRALHALHREKNLARSQWLAKGISLPRGLAHRKGSRARRGSAAHCRDCSCRRVLCMKQFTQPSPFVAVWLNRSGLRCSFSLAQS